jgi:hypothetical protein
MREKVLRTGFEGKLDRPILASYLACQHWRSPKNRPLGSGTSIEERNTRTFKSASKKLSCGAESE